MTEQLQTEQTQGGGDCLCYSCRLFDRLRGCDGLSDTFFGGRPCPFYKPIAEEKKPKPKGCDCESCFASSPIGCRALVAPPRERDCVFYKHKDDYEKECRRLDKRIREYIKKHPEVYDKYYALREPKRFHGNRS